MAEDDSSKYRLDLDASDFIASGLEAKGVITELGEANLEGLISGLTEVGMVVGVLGAAFFAVKETFETVFEVENIKAVAQQFDMLSASAGVFGDKLKSDLKEASNGLIDDVSLMQSANKAMVGLETGVDKLGEVMQLARQATMVFGGDLQQNFELMTQAIERGNVRQLRQLGIIIDQNKAYRDFAKSIGTTVDALSQAGKQQAVLNALLEQGGTKFKGVNADIKEAQTIWEQTKTTWKEVADVIKVAFEKVAGPAVHYVLKEIRGLADAAMTIVGDKAQQNEAKVRILQDRLDGLKEKLKDLEETQKRVGHGDPIQAARRSKQIEQLHMQILSTKTSLAQLGAVAEDNEKKLDAANAKAAKGHHQASFIDPDKAKKQQAQFKADMEKLDADLMQKQIQDMATLEEADKLYYAKKKAEAQKYVQQMEQVKAKEAEGALTHKQAEQEIAALDKLRVEAMKTDEEELSQFRQQALTKWVSQSDSAGEGISRAMTKTSLENKKALKEWGDYGTSVSNSFASHSVSSLQAWASGQKAAGDAVMGFFGGMVGDMATNYGKMLMLASVWPPNPPALAAGIALVALGGYLGSLGGGSPSGANVAPGSPADTAATQGVGAAISSGPLNGAAATASPQKSVNLIIQGHMFGTDETQRWITQMVRNNADATDFKVQSVGGGL